MHGDYECDRAWQETKLADPHHRTLRGAEERGDDHEQKEDADHVVAGAAGDLGQPREESVRFGRVETPVEDLQVGVHPLPVGVVLGSVRAKEISGNQRRDHARDEQAHQHGDDDGEAEGLEVLAGNSGHQCDGQEHRDDRHRRREHRESDLVGGIERGLIAGFAHAHVANDILDLDDRVIDENAGDEAHRHCRHEVHVDVQKAHEPEGRDRRQRNGQSRYDRCAYVAQEQEDDDDRQYGALDQPFHRGVVLSLGVIDGVEDLGEMNPRILFLQFAHRFPARLVGGHLGRALGPLHREGDDLAPVHLGDGALLRSGIPDFAEIGQAGPLAARQRDLRLRQIVGVARIAEDAHRLLGARDFGAPAGRVQIALPELCVDLRRGDSLSLQSARIEGDANGPVDAARTRNRGDRPQRPAGVWRRCCRCTSSILQASCRWFRHRRT